MKFDFVIGNPPYQDSVEESENKTFMPPVYNLFMDASYQVGESVELIHPARFLFNAGQTPKAWNEKMLNDPHFKILKYEVDASTIFPNTYINGGVVVSFYSQNADYGPIGVFTPFEQLNCILRKTHTQDHLGTHIYNQNRFNLDALYKEHPDYKEIIGSEGRDKRFRNNIFEKIPLFSDEAAYNDDIHVLGIEKSKRVWKFIPRRFVDYNHENLLSWKVLLSCADGAAGTIGNPIPARILGEPFITKPNDAYTQTFVGVGAFSSEKEANAAYK